MLYIPFVIVSIFLGLCFGYVYPAASPVTSPWTFAVDLALLGAFGAILGGNAVRLADAINFRRSYRRALREEQAR